MCSGLEEEMSRFLKNIELRSRIIESVGTNMKKNIKSNSLVLLYVHDNEIVGLSRMCSVGSKERKCVICEKSTLDLHTVEFRSIELMK